MIVIMIMLANTLELEHENSLVTWKWNSILHMAYFQLKKWYIYLKNDNKIM